MSNQHTTTTMTWRQVFDWLSTISLSDLDKPAIVYDAETECFAAVVGFFLATDQEDGEVIWNRPDDTLGEGQPILKI